MPDKNLIVTSSAFEDGGFMPIQYTGYGSDDSPPLTLSGISPEAVSIAVIMADMDVPFIRAFPHWLIWNLPVSTVLPSAIPKGEYLAGLGGAAQGLAYGRHVYAGPKPPKFIRTRHRYVFTVYVLDRLLEVLPKG